MSRATRTIATTTATSTTTRTSTTTAMATAMARLAVTVSLALTAAPTRVQGAADWRFLDQYPAHYVAKKLSASESIVIDGRMDDAAWDDAEWTLDMVDITRHSDQHSAAAQRRPQRRAGSSL